MRFLRMAGAAVVLFAVTACDVTGLSSQAYPGRTQHQFMSADRAMILTYACVPSDTERQTQQRAAQAHRYVDGAIRSAAARVKTQPGMMSGLATRAELNAEIAEISRQAEAEYRCVLMNRKNA